MKKIFFLFVLGGIFFCFHHAQAKTLFEQNKTDSECNAYAVSEVFNVQNEPYIQSENDLKSVTLKLSAAGVIAFETPGRFTLLLVDEVGTWHFSDWHTSQDLNQDLSGKDVIFSFPQGDFNLKSHKIMSIGLWGEGIFSAYGSNLHIWLNSQYVAPNTQINQFATGTFYIKIEDYDTKKSPVLIVPGVLGTDIMKGSELLWANPKMARGFDSFMDPLTFNDNLNPIDTSLTIGEVIRNKQFLGFGLNYTDGLIHELINQGYIEGVDLFTFPYDWRFGVNSSNVNALDGQIKYILNKTGANSVNIVAHSTGGLIVKKYVQEHPSDHNIHKAIFVGVPNLGSPKALKALLIGDDFGITNLDPAEMKKLSQNMPVVYDLAPSPSYYKKTDGTVFTYFNPLEANSTLVSLPYQTAISNLIDHGQLNSLAINNSAALHDFDFENLNLALYSIDAYSVQGCKSGTFGSFSEIINKDGTPNFDFPKITDGDETVPFLSSDSLIIDPAKKYFVPKVKHSNLLSANGPRQQIVNLLTDSQLSTSGKVLNSSDFNAHPEKCLLKGHYFWFRSPINPQISDQEGNTLSIAADGSIQNNIPGADYEAWGDHKYFYLPTGDDEQYNLQFYGTGTGNFTINDETIDNGKVTQTQVFSNIPVTPLLRGSIGIGNVDTLSLDSDGNGTIDQTIQPSSILSANESQDLLPPSTTPEILGTQGKPGFYRSGVHILLHANDPVVAGRENQTSGNLGTKYKIDNGEFINYNPASPIVVESEGNHTLVYFSTDRAGNNEPEKSMVFTIDKTAPELTFAFNPEKKDINFSATDNLSPSKNILLADNGNSVQATDEAGNKTQLNMKDAERKKKMAMDIAGLLYNGAAQNIGKTTASFSWTFAQNGNLQSLRQQIKSICDFMVDATYKNGATTITGKDAGGKINQTFLSLRVLTVSTSKGNFVWGY